MKIYYICIYNIHMYGMYATQYTMVDLVEEHCEAEVNRTNPSFISL